MSQSQIQTLHRQFLEYMEIEKGRAIRTVENWNKRHTKIIIVVGHGLIDMFENKDKPDEFFVFFSNGFEAKALLSLDKLVDATLTCNNNKKFLNELANNFEMLAKRLRDA